MGRIRLHQQSLQRGKGKRFGAVLPLMQFHNVTDIGRHILFLCTAVSPHRDHKNKLKILPSKRERERERVGKGVNHSRPVNNGRNGILWRCVGDIIWENQVRAHVHQHVVGHGERQHSILCLHTLELLQPVEIAQVLHRAPDRVQTLSILVIFEQIAYKMPQQIFLQNIARKMKKSKLTKLHGIMDTVHVLQSKPLIWRF